MDRDEKARELARLVRELGQGAEVTALYNEQQQITLAWHPVAAWQRMIELAKQLLKEASPEQ